MIPAKIKISVFLLLVSVSTFAQLGFCTGSKGEAIFSENFGNGTTYGPALPAGTTTYPFIAGAPNDGFYTLFYHSSFFQPSWHYSLDHTPDATNGPNGKMLLVNANAVTSGDFYKKIVTGLCVNTTFEFSAWLLNVYNPTSNICVNQIPINVRFEIWNSTETILLSSGNTGNIFGTPSPLWQQFALVFTTTNETSVVLKMKNNGIGGCGNDLAIDDIEFRSCGDLTTVTSPSVVGDTFSTCVNPTSLQLNAATAGSSTYFYQWQTSSDGINWTDIPGANNATYNTPNLTSVTYFRTRAAQDLANLSNPFCSTISNVFTVNVLPVPSAGVSNGDLVICNNQPITPLSVNTGAGLNVNWYDAPTGGNLLQANSPSFLPTAAGIYYAETIDTVTNCIGSPRTPVELTLVTPPNATISGATSICSGGTAVINFTGTPNANLIYTVNGGANQSISLNASGVAGFTTPALTATTTYTLVSAASSALNTCSTTINDSVVITVNNSPSASISSISQVCSGSSATVNFSGTAGATVRYSVNGGSNQSIILNASGSASVVIPSVTSTLTYTLVDVALGGLCTQTLSQSTTITSVTIPTATISASPLAVCSNQTSTITFNGTPNANLVYSINGGANQSISLNGSGTASFTTSALTSNTTVTLISATSAALNTCSTTINDSVVITVNALPTATISSNSPVCFGTSATVTFTGTPGATVTYSGNGSPGQTTVLNSSGTASVVVPNVTSTTTYSLISVTSGVCTQPLSQSIAVTSVPLPTASISASPLAVCANQTSTITFTGTPNAVVTYSANGSNQSVTLNSAGSASVTTNPLTADTTYQLTNAALGTGCSQSLSASATVTINPTPNVTFTGNLTYCEGETIAINLSSAIAGTTFNWTVNQIGTSGASAGSGNQISQPISLNSDSAGTVIYTVTPVFNGCSGTPINITVTINPKPVPQITDGVICTTGASQVQSYMLNTNLSAANHSFQWFLGGILIPGASGSSYQANQIGTYSVIATSAAGCVSDTVSAVITEAAQGESLIVQQSAAFSDNPTVTVTVVGGGGPFFYQMDNGPLQSSNVFYSVPDGLHTINVVDGYCTNLTTTVRVIGYPKYFTPNGDGIHDTWNITGIDNAVLRIFDRYGKLIKQISPDGQGWDGTYNGSLLPSTDYWFTIDYFENGASKTFRAHFSLKR